MPNLVSIIKLDSKVTTVPPRLSVILCILEWTAVAVGARFTSLHLLLPSLPTEVEKVFNSRHIALVVS